MKLRIRYMYEKGNTGFLELLLSSANLTEFFNRAEYVQKISEYDRRQLNRYEVLCRDVKGKQQRLEQEKAELLSLAFSTRTFLLSTLSKCPHSHLLEIKLSDLFFREGITWVYEQKHKNDNHRGNIIDRKSTV